MELRFIGPATVTVDDDFATFSALLENDERVQFCLDEDDMNQIVTAWLARDTPALAMPLDSRKIAESLFCSNKPSAKYLLRP